MKIFKNSVFIITSSIILIVIALASLLTITYSWYTDKGDTGTGVRVTFGEVETTVLVNDSSLNTISVSDLSYVDIINDFKNNNYSVLNELATTFTISLENTGDIDVRALINITFPTGVIGLVLLDTTIVDYYTQISSILTTETTAADIRTTIDTYNTSQLESLYETVTNVYGTNDTVSVKVVMWGDYDDLSTADKAIYLTKQFSVALSIKAIQAHSGGVDYAND